MPKTIGCILARQEDCLSSTSHLFPRIARSLAGRPLIEWVVRRTSESQHLAEVVVVVPDSHCEEAVHAHIPASAKLLVSSQADEAKQLLDAAEATQANAVVHVQNSSPLLDPALLDRLVLAGRNDANKTACISFTSRQAGSQLHAKLGLVAEWYQTAALRRAAKAKSPSAGLLDFFLQNADEYALRFLTLPAELDRNDFRLAVRAPEDWHHAEEIVEALGDDGLDWQRIASLLDSQPVMLQRMAQLNLEFDRRMMR
ncbi:MAG: NTP transferase domain-containing protein [Pirellulaceae bacterium]